MNTFMQKLGVLAAMLSTFLSVFAYDFEANGIYYNITDPTAKEVEVTYQNDYNLTSEYSGDIVVPSSVSYNDVEYSVTAIGDWAFSNCSSLTSITLTNSLITIGNSAFNFCWNLTSIIIPNSVTSIGNNAFSQCNNLTTITIPNSVTDIGDNAFARCNSLTSIDVDADNQTYSSIDGILYDKSQTSLIYCPNGKAGEVIIPNSVTVIREDAFSVCSLSSITIPNSVTFIGRSAFSQCSNLTSITIPNSVTDIGNYAFEKCSSLTTITIPSFVTTIGEGTFHMCENLTTITLPNSLTTIKQWAFSRCRSLTSITLPNSVTTIGYCAFVECSGLTTISLPNSVTTIETEAFAGCSSLTSIDVDADNQTYSSNDGILYDKSQTKLIYCPEGKTGEIIILNSVTIIGEVAFSNCSNLTTITLPNSVMTIGRYVFSGCSSLTSITSLAVNPPECEEQAFEDIDKQKCTLYVPAESVEAYKQAPEWKDFVLVEEVEAGIDSVAADYPNGATGVFNLTGAKVADTLENLPAGIYLVREGSTVRKIAVR